MSSELVAAAVGWRLKQNSQMHFVVPVVDSTGWLSLQTTMNRMYSVAAAVAAAAYLSQAARKAPSMLVVDFVAVRQAGQKARLKLVDFVVGSGSDQKFLLRKGMNPDSGAGFAADSRSLRSTAAYCRKSNLGVLSHYFDQTEHYLRVPVT